MLLSKIYICMNLPDHFGVRELDDFKTKDQGLYIKYCGGELK